MSETEGQREFRRMARNVFAGLCPCGRRGTPSMKRGGRCCKECRGDRQSARQGVREAESGEGDFGVSGEGVGPDAFVTVRVSREMLAILSDGWSPPVRVRISPDASGEATHTMEAMLARTLYRFEGESNQ